MPVLLVFLKILGVVLLLLVLALLAALFIPMRLHFEYRPGRVRLSASYGPFRRTIFSRGKRRKKQASAATEPQSPPVRTPEPAARSEQTAARQTEVTQGPETPVQEATPGEQIPELPPISEIPPAEEEEETGRLEHILTLAPQQPMVLLRCLADHFNWMRHHAVCKLRIRHLDVFWTVTCEDAADTAVAFGAEMAAFNTMLALLQQSISVQSDRLWLEPDFTGMRRGERRISFSFSACAILMFGLAYRLWKDPLLQPEAAATHA